MTSTVVVGSVWGQGASSVHTLSTLGLAVPWGER